jgi:hypothetical protein
LATDQHLGLDDHLVLLTLLCLVPNVAITIGPAKFYGRDVWTLSPTLIPDLLRWDLIQTLLYFINDALLKAAFLAFYLRIFPSRTTQRVLKGTMTVVALWGFVFVSSGIFQCHPVSYYWTSWNDGTGSKGECINRDAMVWANAAIGIALDVWMLAIPLWCLRGVQMPVKKKLGVGAMFGVGAL